MTRLKNTLAEDLIAAKKDIERLSEHNVRLNKEKEELTKARGNLVVDLNGIERDNQTLNSVSRLENHKHKSAIQRFLSFALIMIKVEDDGGLFSITVRIEEDVRFEYRDRLSFSFVSSGFYDKNIYHDLRTIRYSNPTSYYSRKVRVY